MLTFKKVTKEMRDQQEAENNAKKGSAS